MPPCHLLVEVIAVMTVRENRRSYWKEEEMNNPMGIKFMVLSYFTTI